jgi:hypothetical protein
MQQPTEYYYNCIVYGVFYANVMAGLSFIAYSTYQYVNRQYQRVVGAYHHIDSRLETLNNELATINSNMSNMTYTMSDVNRTGRQITTVANSALNYQWQRDVMSGVMSLCKSFNVFSRAKNYLSYLVTKRHFSPEMQSLFSPEIQSDVTPCPSLIPKPMTNSMGTTGPTGPTGPMQGYFTGATGSTGPMQGHFTGATGSTGSMQGHFTGMTRPNSPMQGHFTGATGPTGPTGPRSSTFSGSRENVPTSTLFNRCSDGMNFTGPLKNLLETTEKLLDSAAIRHGVSPQEVTSTFMNKVIDEIDEITSRSTKPPTDNVDQALQKMGSTLMDGVFSHFLERTGKLNEKLMGEIASSNEISPNSSIMKGNHATHATNAMNATDLSVSETLNQSRETMVSVPERADQALEMMANILQNQDDSALNQTTINQPDQDNTPTPH